MMVATEIKTKSGAVAARLLQRSYYEPWPFDAEDPTLSQVFWAKWGLYSDFRAEYVKAELQRNYSAAKAVHKYLMFLESGLEYEWVGSGLSGNSVSWIFELLDKHRREINRAGDQSVWPFYRKEDYTRAWKQHN